MRTPRFRSPARAAAAALLGCALAVLPCAASDPPKPWYEQLTVNAFLSASYSYNFNRPESGLNRYRVFDFDDNTFKFDVAEIVLQKPVREPLDVGFRVDVAFGSSIPRVVAAADVGSGREGAQDYDVHQGFLTWIAPVGSGLKLDFGKFITHHGYEVIEGYDGYDDNATRSFLFGYAIPFTHTGVRAAYAFSGKVSAMLMVVNGWDNGKDNNASKSVGAQATLTPTASLTIYLNGMTGPERDGDDRHARTMLDLAATFKASDRLSLGINFDRGSEEDAPVTEGLSRNASWGGGAVYAKVAVTPKLSLALRAEQFDDSDGFRTGTAQRLREITLTPEYRASPHLVLRGDLRLDTSDAEVFEKDARAADRQATALFNAIVVF
ncbi:MAG: porin [Acidobacteriia bacterium]|nr:porin [Terriglobia bacterium]